MELYRFPELYDAVRSPDDVTVSFVRGLLKKQLNGSLTSIMDPACGPGTWLLPFAGDGIRLAGNDNSPCMIQDAHRRLNGSATELVEGDMCDLRFRTGPFDVALELAGTIGHLPDDDSILRFLKSVSDQVRKGGLVLLLVPFEDRDETPVLPAVYWTMGPIALPSGGHTSVVYEIVQRIEARQTERIRRTVRTYNADHYPRQIEDDYWLRVTTPPVFLGLLAQVPELKLLSVYRQDEPSNRWDATRPEDLKGERILMFERV